MSTRVNDSSFNLLDLVDELRDLGSEERGIRLDRLELTPEQRAEVEKCLAALPRAEAFLELPPTLVRNAWADLRAGTATPMLGAAGQTFGEYRLIEHLASGTFGEVWVAVHRSLDTPTAVPTCLKLLYPDRSDLEDVLREARTMASIRHENVVSVRRADRALLGGREIPFIEMELVGEFGEGGRFEPAKSLAVGGVEGGRPSLTVTEAAKIVSDACRGVHAAHLRGTLHRDLKPANTLLEIRSRRAKVTDFGIASHFVSNGAIVGPSKGLGTPAYMAPEQARGQPTQLSDVYALGAVLYFLLAGRAPFGEEPGRPSSSDWRQILDQLQRGESSKPLHVVVGGLPRTLLAIVNRAMAADPASRYASAAAMADDLDAFRAATTTAAAPPGPAGRVWLWARRNPMVALLSLAVLVALTVGPAVYIHGLRREQQRTEAQRQIAVANEHSAVTLRERAEREYARGLVLQGDAWALGGRWLQARSLYGSAAVELKRLGLPTFAADTGLWVVEQSTLLPLLEWSAPAAPPLAMDFSPDGRFLATGGGDKILRLWDPVTGRLVREFPASPAPIMSLAFSPDGSSIAIAGGGGMIRVISTEGNAPAKILDAGKRWIFSVAFSPDGGLVSAGGDDRTVRVWDVRTNELRATIPFKHSVRCMRFFPDSRRLAVVADAVHMVDWQSRAVIRSFPGRAVTVTLSADGTRLLSEGEPSGLNLWDTSDGRLIRTLPGHAGQISAGTFIGTRTDRAVTAGWDKAVRVWDLDEGKELVTFSPHEGWTLCAALAPDGRRLITSGYDRAAPMRLWDLQPSPVSLVGEARDLSPDGRCALVVGRDGLLHVTDLATGADLAKLPDSKDASSIAVFRKGISQVISMGGEGTVRQWQVGPVARLTSKARSTSDWGAVSPDGRFSVRRDRDAMVMRDVQSDRKVWKLSLNQPWDAARFSQDGNVIAAWGDATPAVSVVDAGTGRLMQTLQTEGDYVTSVCLNRDGSRLLSATGADVVQFWDTRTGTMLRSLVAHGSTLTTVALAPDASWAIGCGEEPTAWVWDTSTGLQMRAIPIGRTPAGIRVSQDGSRALIRGNPPTFCDFGRAVRLRELESRVKSARDSLDRSPDDPQALATLGEWYAFRHADEVGVKLMRQAQAASAHVPTLELARAYWRLGNAPEAAAEFKRARAENAAPEDYLDLCIAAAERDAMHQDRK